MNKEVYKKWLEGQLTEWDGKLQEIKWKMQKSQAEHELLAEYEHQKALLQKKLAEADSSGWDKIHHTTLSWFATMKEKYHDILSK